ncbi:MAG: hypothetical protein ACOC5M_02205, partial [Chloroflexota bacterium]
MAQASTRVLREEEEKRRRPAAVAAVSLWMGRSVAFSKRWPIIPVFILSLLLVAGIFAPMLAPHDPNFQTLRSQNAPPAWNTDWYAENPGVETTYVLGSDQIGRDVFSRVIHGARISLLVVAIALTTGLLVGTA